MSFVRELKRRNVIRVAIAYVIVAWLTAQVTELALSSFAAPDWVLKTVLFLLVMGFPFALILSWAFELTPEEAAYNMQGNLLLWYLFFEYLDRHFELIFDLDPVGTGWTDAEVPLHDGSVFRRLGFTAHPKYLEAVALIGIVELWEQRGPPDFCKKTGGNWICE